jgi:hypothetical protein
MVQVLPTNARTLCATVIAIAVACLLAGCDSIDPTEQSFGIAFDNNLTQPIKLKLCSDDSCHSYDYTDMVKSGEFDSVNVSDRGVLTRWLVAGSTGRILGCLPVRFNGKYADVIVRVSQAVPCPGEKPLSVQHGHKVGNQV